jgi:hypothetical protein
MSDTGIQLFDSKARLLPVEQIEAQITDEQTRKRFEAVREAHAETERIDAALVTMQDELKVLVGEFADAEAQRKLCPQVTHLQLVRESQWRNHQSTRMVLPSDVAARATLSDVAAASVPLPLARAATVGTRAARAT